MAQLETRIDLRELRMIEGLEEGFHVEGGVGMITVHSTGLPPGAYSTAVILASAGLQRFVEELFVETASQMLRLPEPMQKPFRKSFQGWGNPSSENIFRLYTRLGLEVRLEEHSEKLKALIERRNLVVHGRASDSFQDRDPGPVASLVDDRKFRVTELREFVEEVAVAIRHEVQTQLNDRLSPT